MFRISAHPFLLHGTGRKEDGPMGEGFDIKNLIGMFISILIAVAIGMGLYDIVSNLVGEGLFFDLKLQEILNAILSDITGKLGI